MQDPQILTIKGKIKILEVGKGRADRITSTRVGLDRDLKAEPTLLFHVEASAACTHRYLLYTTPHEVLTS